MVTHGVLGVIGFSSGLAVAGGVIALLIGLGSAFQVCRSYQNGQPSVAV